MTGWDEDTERDRARSAIVVDYSSPEYLAFADAARAEVLADRGPWREPSPAELDLELKHRWRQRLMSAADDVLERLRSFRARMPERSLVAAIELVDGSDRVSLDVRRWIADQKRNLLVFSGPAGTGKTSRAVWTFHADPQRRRAPAFITSAKLAQISRYDEEERSPIYDASALILDDLGAEYLDPKGSFLVDLDELIDGFYRSTHRTLVMTTNLDAKRFEDRFGARIVDRLHEAGAWIVMAGPSLRRGRS